MLKINPKGVGPALMVGAPLVALIGFGAWTASIVESQTPPARISINFPSCATEDSDDCIWDGTENGNKTGHIILNIDGDSYEISGENRD